MYTVLCIYAISNNMLQVLFAKFFSCAPFPLAWAAHFQLEERWRHAEITYYVAITITSDTDMGGGGGDAADKHKQKQTSRFSEVFGRQSLCLLVSLLFFEASLSVANYFPTKSWRSGWWKMSKYKSWRRLYMKYQNNI